MRISSYSFILILLKLHRCFGHGLKICMWFGYNPQIIFYHFFCYFNLGIFLAFLLSKLMDTGYLVYYIFIARYYIYNRCMGKNVNKQRIVCDRIAESSYISL